MCKIIIISGLIVFGFMFGYIAGTASNATEYNNNANVMFELPDVTTFIYEKYTSFQLEAFKSNINDKLLSENRTDELVWVSIGRPRLVQRYSAKEEKEVLFHYTQQDFYVHVEMLTYSHRLALVKEIKQKYKIDVSVNQILNLVLARFECKMLLSADDGTKILIVGRVEDFRKFPLELHFDAPIDSRERAEFDKRLNKDVLLACDLASTGKILKQNKLSVTSKQINQYNIQEKLFGPANSTYVSRDQLLNLASEMYSSLNVVEEYELPMLQFSEEFVQGIIKQTATTTLKFVPFDEAIASLSKYSLNIQADLKPDVIKSDMGRVLVVAEKNGRKAIKLNEELDQKGNTKDGVAVNNTVGMSFKGISVSRSFGVAVEKAKEWENSKKDASEQINELNTDVRNDVQWKIDGERVVPRGLKVVRLNKASFSKSLSFNRIRRSSFDAGFNKKIALNIHKDIGKAKPDSSPVVGSIIAIVYKTVLESFTNNGIGLNDYKGWYLCNGQNDTPDLTGRFLVGYDKTDNDFDTIGKLGGTSNIQLSIKQLPAHSHVCSNHRHWINVITTAAGSHSHAYKDIFYTEHGGWVPVPNNFGSRRSDNDNTGFQISRDSFLAGGHSHRVQDKTVPASATIQYTGENRSHENRPPYYAVAYIIYKGTN